LSWSSPCIFTFLLSVAESNFLLQIPPFTLNVCCLDLLPSQGSAYDRSARLDVLEGSLEQQPLQTRPVLTFLVDSPRMDGRRAYVYKAEHRGEGKKHVYAARLLPAVIAGASRYIAQVIQSTLSADSSLPPRPKNMPMPLWHPSPIALRCCPKIAPFLSPTSYVGVRSPICTRAMVLK
jgi:hypothetical protein